MKAKHTPGPWTYLWREDLHKFRIGPDNDSMPVAGTVNQADPDDEEANARLIAAAPELLGACQATIEAIRGYEKRTGSKQLVPLVRMLEKTVLKALGDRGV